METPTTEPVVQNEPVAAVEPAAPQDPFSLDENRLISLSPEQRAALEPVIDEWRSKAKAEIEKNGKTYEERYKPHEEKAKALDQLVRDPRFQNWYRSVQAASAQQNPQAASVIQQAKPQDFATPQEYQDAWANAYAGDYSKFNEIQARMFSAMATPVVQQLRQGQEELRTTLAMKDLFERHQDAKELDAIGRDSNNPNDNSESLLESCLNWADANGLSLEEGYAKARRWADAIRVGAQKQAMGLVQDKKASITSGPSTNKESQAVIEVEDADELMSRNMEYLASGQKPPKFVIRKQEVVSNGNRWSQRA